MNREFATKLLVADKFPLMTVEVQDAYNRIHATRPGSPPGNHFDALDLWKEHNRHFGRFLYDATGRDTAERVVVYEDPNDEQQFTEAHRAAICELLREFVSYRYQLSQLPSEEFMALYQPLRDRREDMLREEASRHDLDQFFSFPEADADLAYWLSQPSWSLEEATALAFGKDPDIVTRDTLSAISHPEKSIFIKQHHAFGRTIAKAQAAGLLKNPIDPHGFCSWVTDQNVALPSSSMLSHYNQHARSVALASDDKVKAAKEEIRTQAVHSMYRIILGIIICKYGSTADPHDITRQREKYPQILEDIKSVSISMDKDTLEKYLDAAYAYAREKERFGASRGKNAHARKS